MSKQLGHCAICFVPVYDDESYVHTHDGTLYCIVCYEEFVASVARAADDIKKED